MRRLNDAMRGFTLMEVLVGMTLLSMMLVLLFGSLKMSSESWERGEKKILDVNEAAAVYNFFRRYLQTAMPLLDYTNNEEQALSFQGKKDALQFVSVRPASFIGPREQLYSVSLERLGNEQVIKVAMTPFFPSAEGEEWQKDEEILLRNVQHLSFEYFGSDEGETNPRWQDEWLMRSQLPQLIKIKIVDATQDVWPELIVDLKASASASLVSVDSQNQDNNDGNNEDEAGFE